VVLTTRGYQSDLLLCNWSRDRGRARPILRHSLSSPRGSSFESRHRFSGTVRSAPSATLPPPTLSIARRSPTVTAAPSPPRLTSSRYSRAPLRTSMRISQPPPPERAAATTSDNPPAGAARRRAPSWLHHHLCSLRVPRRHHVVLAPSPPLSPAPPSPLPPRFDSDIDARRSLTRDHSTIEFPLAREIDDILSIDRSQATVDSVLFFFFT
jgi:hypothetical protein